jgi:branched-chain amino acid transport system ATP-binding protein
MGSEQHFLQLAGVSKRFGGVVATDQVNLEVTRGEVHALIGPNGAGKTTLISQIAGGIPIDAGSVRFLGEDITRLAQHQRVARGLARSYQITSIFKRFSVLENLALAVQARSGSSFSFWRPVESETALFTEARALAREVNLENRVDALAGNLAHGEQRALEVGLALATRPKLMLLDEPMAGMGPEESQRMIALIARIRSQVTVLLVEHDMDAVFRLADRITVLVNGRVIASGRPDEIRSHTEVKRAYLGDELAA